MAALVLVACAAPQRLDRAMPQRLDRAMPQHLESGLRQLHREFLAMGTRIGVTVVVRDRADERRAQTAIGDVEHHVRDFGSRWWAWGDGELAAINRSLAAGSVAEIPEGMRPLFARAWHVREATRGNFEPRIGALVRLWGFDDVARIRSTPPADVEIRRGLHRLRSAPRYDGGARYGPAPGIAWDFGAIAKGWIVDEALAQLAAAGFADAMVDAGGNLATRGTAGARPWRVAIRDPRSSADRPSFLGELDTGDEAVNTHADDQRSFESGGVRYGHILDPRTGKPARGLLSVTVVHRDGALADAGGVALFVAGPKHWRDLARKLQLEQVLVLDADGRIFLTPALSRRIKITAGTATTVALY